MNTNKYNDEDSDYLSYDYYENPENYPLPDTSMPVGDISYTSHCEYDPYNRGGRPYYYINIMRNGYHLMWEYIPKIKKYRNIKFSKNHEELYQEALILDKKKTKEKFGNGSVWDYFKRVEEWKKQGIEPLI